MSGGSNYRYDGDNLRTSKTVNGATTQYAWDESGSLPLLLQDGSTYYIYGPGGQPIEQINGTTPIYLLADQQGSTRLLADGSGNVVGTYTYDPWGDVTSHTGTATTRLQYDGQYADAGTGYQYLRARYYDSSTGQFITPDPLEAVTQAGSYGADTPLNASDPSGMFCLIGSNPGGGCRGASETKATANVVHFVSGAVGVVAGGCAVASVWTGVGTIVCGGVATVAGGISLASGEVLYATSGESTAGLGGDVAGSIPFLGPVASSVQEALGAYGTGSTINQYVHHRQHSGYGATSSGTGTGCGQILSETVNPQGETVNPQ